MAHTPIIPVGSAPPLAPYSPGVRAGNNIYVSGMLAIDKDGKSVGIGDISAQTRHVLESIKAVLETAGASMSDIAYNAIILKDLADYAAMNKVYAEYFPANPPARYCIRADLVKPEFLIEITSVAYVGS
ncbi:MAG: pyrimidine utilization protein C [Burkholderiaceae bacterium]|nr:pyrimidine utilization protein C [Burkholderiaceae bacterium]MCD8516121.1 pyrimidine utilization protein C [Burkholderiaceae bacterium]MCD8536295.1 pyrimidine utilization protein C [Burkholderiaceae bacterium]MCD8564768.1 pyrimidine utilization protein C [Burkholderiaceae bacterium]